MQGIYKITNKNNGKCYIGQSVDIHQRWLEHRSTAFLPHRKDYKYPLYRAIRKYGIENFEFEVLQEVESKDDLTYYEIYWYKFYKPDYNQVYPTKSVTSISRPVYQIDTKTLKIVGEFPNILEATRLLKIDNSHITSVCKGKEITAGGYHWCYQEKWNENWKPRKPKKKKQGTPVCQIDIKTKEVLAKYDNATEASKIIGIDNSSISKVCKGRMKQAGGYLWDYDNNRV